MCCGLAVDHYQTSRYRYTASALARVAGEGGRPIRCARVFMRSSIRLMLDKPPSIICRVLDAVVAVLHALRQLRTLLRYPLATADRRRRHPMN